MRTDEGQSWLLNQRWLQSLLLILLITTVPASTAIGQEANASDALAAKEQAITLRDELESLNKQGEVDVDKDILATVNREIKKGKLAVDSGEYNDAKNHFDRATVQARAELTRSYADGAKTLLTGSENYLASLQEQGYTTTKIGVLQERISKQHQKLGNADDLQSTRNVYADAEAIQADTKNLPQPWVVRAVDHLTSGLAMLLVVLLLLGIAAGWYVRTNSHRNNGPKLH